MSVTTYPILRLKEQKKSQFIIRFFFFFFYEIK